MQRQMNQDFFSRESRESASCSYRVLQSRTSAVATPIINEQRSLIATPEVSRWQGNPQVEYGDKEETYLTKMPGLQSLDSLRDEPIVE